MKNARDLFQSLLHPDLNVQRNGFDLSHRKIFTAKAGELNPILCKECLPQDYFEISSASLLRTFPLNTAAFLRAKVCFDFFFVPSTAVWSRYQDFISQRKDKRSSYTRGAAYEPNVSISFLRSCVANAAQVEEGVDPNPIDSRDARTKLLNLLGYGYIGGYWYNDWPRQDADKSLTALPIAGYNLIYNQYYRNAWRDEPSDYDIQNQNLDFVPCTTYENSLVDNYVEYDFVSMHYHQWYKDLFTGSLPSQQFGNVSSISVPISNVGPNTFNFTTGSDNGRWSFGDDVENGDNVLANVSNTRITAGGSSTSSNYATHTHSGQIQIPSAAFGASFDVITLRKALALQKWKEYNMRAGWKNSPQQKAQYGSGIPLDIEHDIQFIDSYESPIQIDEVISHSNTSSPESGNGNLGEIAGKGIGFNSGHTIKFTAPVPGYLYCISYVLPQADYDAVGFDKQLMRSEPFDHFIPAFENTGLVPVTVGEMNAQYGLLTEGASDIVLGYAPYGYEYKTDVDKNYGAFMDYLVVDRSADSNVPMQQSGSLSPWVSNRSNFLEGVIVDGSVRNEAFYVSPSSLDRIFVKAADGSKESDQFMLNVNFDIKAVRGMSKLGLPTI